MTIEMTKDFLLFCSMMNIVLFLIWFLLFTLVHDFIYRMHNKWFKISVETFDAIHYAGIVTLKTFILFFNIVPYIALLIM